MIIRLALPEDSVAIARVHILARQHALPYSPELHDELETIGWIENVVLPNQIVWLAVEGDRIAGFAALNGQVLEHLYVLPDAQGRGIGSVLLQTVMDHAGITLELWTFQRNQAVRRFYERRGFTADIFTDGSDNEEQEPDVLYRWQAT